MRIVEKLLAVFCLLLAISAPLSATPKTHVVAFGHWTTTRILTGMNQDQPLEIKIRPLLVDGLVKVYTFGTPHEITDRLLVVRRMLRINDSLPSEGAASHWIWQRAGWLIVDRATGHLTPTTLPQFDPEQSDAAWYRDYTAYCGSSDDGQKLFAMVVQLGRRKPLLKKQIAESDAATCSSSTWQRQPPRVTFTWNSDQKLTFTIHGTSIELTDAPDDQNPE